MIVGNMFRPSRLCAKGIALPGKKEHVDQPYMIYIYTITENTCSINDTIQN